MAYTNVWNVTDPPGSEQAKNIDDHIRKLRLDIQERMNSLVTSWSADPVVLSDAYAGKKDADILIIPAVDFQYSNVAAISADGKVTYSGFWGFPIQLPVGSKITKVECLIDRGANGSIDWTIRKYAFAAGAPSSVTTLDTVVHTASGVAISSSIALTYVTTVTDIIVVSTTGSASLTAYNVAARITFDRPRIA